MFVYTCDLCHCYMKRIFEIFSLELLKSSKGSLGPVYMRIKMRFSQSDEK